MLLKHYYQLKNNDVETFVLCLSEEVPIERRKKDLVID